MIMNKAFLLCMKNAILHLGKLSLALQMHFGLHSGKNHQKCLTLLTIRYFSKERCFSSRVGVLVPSEVAMRQYRAQHRCARTGLFSKDWLNCTP